MQYQYIVAIVVTIVLIILSPWVRAWNARRVSCLKDQEYDKAIIYINSCFPKGMRPIKAINIYANPEIIIGAARVYCPLSLGALEKLTAEELKYGLARENFIRKKTNGILTLIPILIVINLSLIVASDSNIFFVPDLLIKGLHPLCSIGPICALIMLKPKWENQADIAALDSINDKSIALTALQKIIVNSKSASEEGAGYTSPHGRLAKLNEILASNP
jgi:hypothetical protein